MKKIFTLVVAAFCAVNLFAQSESYVFPDDWAGVNGDKVSTQNVTCTVGLGTNTLSLKNGKFVYSAAEEAVSLNYVTGNANPKDDSGSNYSFSKKNVPTTGHAMKLEVKTGGTLETIVNQGGTKVVWLVDEAGNPHALCRETGLVRTDQANFNGSYVFENVAAGTYYLFSPGSKLGFAGYVFTPVASGIKQLQTAQQGSKVIYNLAGQRVTPNYKGVVIINGKKVLQ